MGEKTRIEWADAARTQENVRIIEQNMKCGAREVGRQVIMQELKPCPFCGNEWPTIKLNNYSATWEIRCPQCDIVFHLGAGEKGRIKERIASAWNSRRMVNIDEYLREART